MTDKEQRAKATCEHFNVWTANRPKEWRDEIPHFAEYRADLTGEDRAEIQQTLEEYVDSL